MPSILFLLVEAYFTELEGSMLQQQSLKATLRRVKALSGGVAANPDYQVKLDQLKEERAELYKLQGTQANQLLALNDTLRSKNAQLVTVESQVQALELQLKEREAKVAEWQRLVEEKNTAIQIVQDELIALQLELLRTDDGKQAGMPSQSGNTIFSGSSAEESKPFHFEKEIKAPHQYPISSVASAAGCHLLVTGSEDQKIILYDLTRISAHAVLKWAEMNGSIVSLAVSKDGKWIASCAAYDSEVVIWSTDAGKVKNTLPYHLDNHAGVPNLVFSESPSGLRLWMFAGGIVRLWDVSRGMLLRTWKDLHASATSPISLIVDTRPDRLWVLDIDNLKVSLINGTNGKIEQSVLVPESLRECHVAFSRSEHTIVCASACQIVGLDLAKQFAQIFNLSELPFTKAISHVSAHPTRADLIAVGTEKGRVWVVLLSPDHWSPRWSELLPSHAPESPIYNLSWGPENTDPITENKLCKLVSVSSADCVIKLWTILR